MYTEAQQWRSLISDSGKKVNPIQEEVPLNLIGGILLSISHVLCHFLLTYTVITE